MKPVMNRVALATLAVALPLANVAAEPFIAHEDLPGTIWASDGSFGWTDVDGNGEIIQGISDGNYLEILGYSDGVFVIKIHWWNEAANLSVVEHGVMVASRDNSFVYVEAEDVGVDHFPGVRGEGFFRITSDSTARMFQLGHTVDGGAGAFATTMTRVEQAPEVPVPQSHPGD
ncbi:MAG: hypothetical protein AAF414_00550 [Pseudomonadota bacterium]